jgi:hypothetical protein
MIRLGAECAKPHHITCFMPSDKFGRNQTSFTGMRDNRDKEVART